MLVSTHNEWDPLEDVIVGRIEHARIPPADRGLRSIAFPGLAAAPPEGPLPPQVLAETAEDLEHLADALTDLGIHVRRPALHDHARPFASPDWQTTGMASCCPRDILLAVGDTLLEAPMVLRPRQHEVLAYRPILRECFAAGARWIAAPRPRLLDPTYIDDAPLAITDDEPLFDAANVLRLGRDLLYQISDSGNHLGALWLQRTLGPDYRVHALAGLYDRMHIDTTLALVRPGLIAVNAARVARDHLPALFRGWDVLWVDDVVSAPVIGHPIASRWVGMNFLMLTPDLAVVDALQFDLIRALERHRVDVLPLRLRHARTIGGGFHCVTLDLRRRGELTTYCRAAREPGPP